MDCFGLPCLAMLHLKIKANEKVRVSPINAFWANDELSG